MTTIAPTCPRTQPDRSVGPTTVRRGRRQAVAPVPVALPVEQVVGGVDTHAETHTAAAVDLAGRTLGHATFPTTTAGYTALLRWMTGFTTTSPAGHVTTGPAGPAGHVTTGPAGPAGDDTTGVVRVGVEGTGTYGAGLARYLRDVAGVEVVEVDRPDRRTRRFAGKSDPIDAEAAARAALNGHAAGTPKLRTGPVEAIRALRVARSSAVGARAQALVQMKSLITTAPQALRDRLRALYTAPAKLVTTCAALRPDPVVLAAGDPTAAAKASLRALARRHQHLSEEITEADAVLDQLVAATAPTLLQTFGVGTEIAGQLLVTAGDNPERLHSEAAFAALCGVSPVPAGSGRTDGAVRLNRGGDRQANSALHRVVITRLRHDQRTQTYLRRRTAEGKPKRAVMRCLKRHVAREIYRLIMLDLAPATAPRAT